MVIVGGVCYYEIARNVFGLPNTADLSASSLGEAPKIPKRKVTKIKEERK